MPDIPSLKSLSYSPLTEGFRSDIIEAQARKDQGYETGNAITEYCLHVQLKLFAHPSERKGRFAQLGFVVAQSFVQMTPQKSRMMPCVLISSYGRFTRAMACNTVAWLRTRRLPF